MALHKPLSATLQLSSPSNRPQKAIDTCHLHFPNVLSTALPTALISNHSQGELSSLTFLKHLACWSSTSWNALLTQHPGRPLSWFGILLFLRTLHLRLPFLHLPLKFFPTALPWALTHPHFDRFSSHPPLVWTYWPMAHPFTTTSRWPTGPPNSTCLPQPIQTTPGSLPRLLFAKPETWEFSKIPFSPLPPTSGQRLPVNFASEMKHLSQLSPLFPCQSPSSLSITTVQPQKTFLRSIWCARYCTKFPPLFSLVHIESHEAGINSPILQIRREV